MKRQIKSLLLSLSFIVTPFYTKADAQMGYDMPMPQGQVPADMQMPSVADIFGGMSEEEITKQVQEAQKLFENLSPEEMAEFEKVIEQTIQTMSPQDLEDIQGIAKMVEPHLEFPEEPKAKEAKDRQPETQEKAPKKTKKEISDTDNVQQLLDNITQQINDVMQKINSDKTLLDEVLNKWPSKTTFENLKRQVIALKQERLAKKLTLKENSEDKELVQQLELFYKELKKLNQDFEVEDTFGLPQSKAQSDKLTKQTKELLALFDDTIDVMMPTLEKFLRKYDPEALQMAKEAEERAKRAQTHAKDSEVKRGSAPAASMPTSGPALVQQPTHGSPGQAGMPYDQSYYDQYGMPYGGYDYPGKGFGDSQFGDKGGAKGPSDKKPNEESKQTKDKEQDKSKEASEEVYDSLEGTLEKHERQYGKYVELDFKKFFDEKYVELYPNAAHDENDAYILTLSDFSIAAAQKAQKQKQLAEDFYNSAVKESQTMPVYPAGVLQEAKNSLDAAQLSLNAAKTSEDAFNAASSLGVQTNVKETLNFLQNALKKAGNDQQAARQAATDAEQAAKDAYATAAKSDPSVSWPGLTAPTVSTMPVLAKLQLPKAGASPANQQYWLTSTMMYEKFGFKNYIDTIMTIINNTIFKVKKEIEDSAKMIATLSKDMNQLSSEKLHKLKNNKTLLNMKKHFEFYQNKFDDVDKELKDANKEIDNKFQTNLIQIDDKLVAANTPSVQEEYKKAHAQLTEVLAKDLNDYDYKTKIKEVLILIDDFKKAIDKAIERKKTTKKSKARQAINI